MTYKIDACLFKYHYCTLYSRNKSRGQLQLCFISPKVRLEDEEPRLLTHFHYTSWRQLTQSEFTKVPKVQFQFIKFVKKINEQTKLDNNDAPLVVHCW